MSILQQIWAFRNMFITVLTPIILLPLPVVLQDRAASCAYAIIIMAIYWVFEVLPMAVTALLPLVIMPPLGVLGAKDLAVNYLKDTNFLFVGGLLVAVAVERWNLHKRIALRVLLLVGAKPKWLMFGFMTVTAFLSMWISNTATTAMMVPIVQAVLLQLNEGQDDDVEGSGELDNELEGTTNIAYIADERKSTSSSYYEDKVNGIDASVTVAQGVPAKVETNHKVPYTNTAQEVFEDEQADKKKDELDGRGKYGSIGKDAIDLELKEIEFTDSVNTVTAKQSKEEAQNYQKVCKGLTMCICYAANIGGMATLTGTGPNLVLSGQAGTLFGDEAGINFSSWFIFAFPTMIICLFIAWVWLQLLFLGWREMFGCCLRRNDPNANAKEKRVKKVIRQTYDEMGPMSFAEIGVLCHFILLALLWLTRNPQFIDGWGSLFPKGFVTDASTGITVAVLLFIFPSKKPTFLCCKPKNDPNAPRPVPALLDWATVQEKFPWNIILILGGSFALAAACKESGLSAWLGGQMEGLKDVPTVVFVLLLCVIVATFTEVTSNTAAASIFLPILAELGVSINVHPLLFMIPATLACSFAFMLPVATPPNAIVFTYGHLRIIDMVKTGIAMNIFCVLIVTFSITTYGTAFFKLDTFPDWAMRDPVANTTIM
ncbi:unnamed protein product, partial [Owenia fusiformis]